MNPVASFSIVRRLTLLVLAVSVLSLALHGLMLSGAMRPRGGGMARSAVTEAEVVRVALVALPRAERTDLAATLAREGLLLERIAGEPPPRVQRLGPPGPPPGDEPNGPGPPGPPPHGPDDRPLLPFGLSPPKGERPPMFDGLADSIAQAANKDVRFVGNAVQGDRHVMRFALNAEGEWWQLDLPLPAPPQREITWPLVGALALVAMAGTLAIVLGIRSIARPLSRLSAAMLARREKLEPIPDPVDAGSEVRAVVHAFNEMVRTLQNAQANQRNMLAGLSHDLRTPLARLKLRVELECSEEVMERARPDFDAFERMIDQFLAYTKGELAPGDEGADEPLMATVVSVVEDYRDVGQPVSVGAMTGGDRPFPELALRRLLSNLVDNALDHGKPPVVVEVRQVDDRLELIVWDQGKGIAEKDLGDATSPFVKLRGGEPSLGHAGLGLAIVTQIAQRHAGEVIVRRDRAAGRAGIGVSLPAGPEADPGHAQPA